jgi:hypothetical protein
MHVSVAVSSKSEESVAPSNVPSNQRGLKLPLSANCCLSVNDFASLNECAGTHYKSNTNYNALLTIQLPSGL